MGKRLAPVLAVLVMLLPAVSYALGLGNIVMNSALNQPLDAEIELLSVEKGDIENLSVRLGSTEDFDRVGVAREHFYTQIKFDIVRKPDGTPYVKLSTTNPVTEPFMDFVVEARWARGRILREFTVLVDPPVLSQEAAPPVQQAAVAAPAPAPVTTTVTSQPTMIRQPVQPAPMRERADLTPVMKRDGELSYGPVKYKDTLFEIANAMRPEGVTTNQMMLALVRSNPQAFYNGNINQLKAGFVLRIEDQAQLAALTVTEANAEVNQHHLEWEARKSGKLVRQTGEAPTSGRVARGEAADADMSAADQARLKLVAPGTEGAGSGASDEEVGRLRQDLLLAAEALDANKQETDELKVRMAEMEEQLEAMQRLIMLKDDEMLALQKQLSKEISEETAEATPEAAMAETPAGEKPADAMEEKPAADEVAKKPADKPKPKKAKPAKPAPAPGLLDDPMVMYGGIGVVLLLVVGLMVYRKRKMSDGFEESILNVGEGGKADELGATASTMEDSSESTMVSDFAMSEMSGMSGMTGEGADVDPISEADVYLAYGRHQQAEDILNEALAKESDRHDIKLKLLEVFFASKNKEAFEKGAQELHDALGDESDPIWEKAVTMGSQLCPNNELFGGTSTESLKEDLAGDASGGEDDLMDFDFDLDSAGGESTGEAGGDSDIDDVFAEIEAATTEEPVAEAAAEEDTSLDLDMDMGSEAIEATEEPAGEEEAKSDDNSLDFDVSSMDFDLDAGSADSTTAEAEPAADKALDMDFGGLEMEAEEPAAEATTETTDAGGLDMETSAEDMAAELDEMLGNDIDELTEDAFGEVDEVGTKLDLAKAYVDMGDSDGARSILDEVMEEGDDNQKAQAKELLGQIG